MTPPTARRRFSFLTAAFLAVAFAAGVALVATASLTADDGPKPIPTQPPFASEEERKEAVLREIEESRQRDVEFRERFIAEGRSLRDLPVGTIHTQYFGPATLEEAVARASAGIVVGTVISQQILDGYVISSIRVEEIIAGADRAEVLVRQTGGPAEEAGRAVAVQLDTDPLLRIGERYLLFLGQCAETAPRPAGDIACTGGRNGSQLQVAADGTIRSRAGHGVWTDEFDGVSADELKGLVAQQTP